MDWVAITVFVALFALVTVLGFVASRWRRGDLDLIDEWGLAGRRLGTFITWFLLSGDLYAAYTFVAGSLLCCAGVTCHHPGGHRGAHLASKYCAYRP